MNTPVRQTALQQGTPPRPGKRRALNLVMNPTAMPKIKNIIKPWQYCNDQHKWIQEEDSNSKCYEMIEKLRIITYNVWFDKAHWKLRARSLLEILFERDPHVMCLQEVTEDFLCVALTQPWIRDNYIVSHSEVASDWHDYAVVMFVKKGFGVRAFNEYELESKYDRLACAAELHLRGTHMVFTTSHLDSNRQNSSYRSQQIEQIQHLLLPKSQPRSRRVSPGLHPQRSVRDASDGRKNRMAVQDSGVVVFCGDFNFCSRWPEEQGCLDLRWRDSWVEISKQNKLEEEDEKNDGYTFDTQTNHMARHGAAIDAGKRVRFDRILYHCKKNEWTCGVCEILGREPLQDVLHNDVAVYPSDHFGLFSELVWSASSLPSTTTTPSSSSTSSSSSLSPFLSSSSLAPPTAKPWFSSSVSASSLASSTSTSSSLSLPSIPSTSSLPLPSTTTSTSSLPLPSSTTTTTTSTPLLLSLSSSSSSLSTSSTTSTSTPSPMSLQPPRLNLDMNMHMNMNTNMSNNKSVNMNMDTNTNTNTNKSTNMNIDMERSPLAARRFPLYSQTSSPSIK